VPTVAKRDFHFTTFLVQPDFNGNGRGFVESGHDVDLGQIRGADSGSRFGGAQGALHRSGYHSASL